ncbi:alpha/beta hydrolase fold domain-containing protein [Chitinophaga sp. Cy-1792]|uniref:poly(ethylene terephthalate) hydrolase family protein n=1 Tax=Chitinophaga sp. Cy-1792 TaxID=2608339 RepID=UPI00141F9B90|nr:alpha/beta hydrolase fold domain-containing protein [Chitinophaga sp. Cy-1792]
MVACKKPSNQPAVIRQPDQPMEGYGSSSYTSSTVIKKNCDDGNTGYWLYLPSDPMPKEAPVIVFNHGYGAWNPACYGAWIKHLVKKGNIVIFPRYQSTIVTNPATYTNNAAAAINRALKLLAADSTLPQPIKGKIAYIGHSYGGVIAANLAMTPATYGVPPPKAIMLACPGTGNAPQGALPSYKSMSSKVKMLLIVEEKDNSAGTTFADMLYSSTTYIPAANKTMITHMADPYGYPAITAEHGEAAATDMTFDSGQRNNIITLSFTSTRVDATDYYCYWRLTDALLDCAFHQQGCDNVYGDSTLVTNMGNWSDGQPLKPLVVR